MKSKKSKLIFITLLYFLSGLCSAYIFQYDYTDSDRCYKNGFWGGLIFIFTTVIIIISLFKMKWFNILSFAVCSYIAYIILYFLTVASSSAIFLVGIILGGIGALSIFSLIKKILLPINFSPKLVFIFGAIPFALNLFLSVIPIPKTIETYYSLGWPGTYFAPIFIFWHSLIGFILTKSLLNFKFNQL